MSGTSTQSDEEESAVEQPLLLVNLPSGEALAGHLQRVINRSVKAIRWRVGDAVFGGGDHERSLVILSISAEERYSADSRASFQKALEPIRAAGHVPVLCTTFRAGLVPKLRGSVERWNLLLLEEAARLNLCFFDLDVHLSRFGSEVGAAGTLAGEEAERLTMWWILHSLRSCSLLPQ